MDNQEFLKVISDPFKKFLSDIQQGKDVSRNGGNDSKLSILHSAIAMDILSRIDTTGIEGYSVMALGVGFRAESIIKKIIEVYYPEMVKFHDKMENIKANGDLKLFQNN